MRRCLALLFVLALIASPAAHAVLPDEVMADPVKEARARNLSRDLRLLVRERIAAGDSDNQVIDFLVARYGEFVLLKPRFERQTLLLWLIPPLVLLGGGVALSWTHSRRRGRVGQERESSALTAEEEAQLRQLTAQDAPPEAL